MLQGSTSAAGCEYDAVVVDTHIFRIHDLISMHILQHAILMDAAGVGKGITPHDGLIGLHGHIHQRGHHTTRGIDLRGIDIRLDTQRLVALQDHRDLLERRVAGALANAVDGDFHLTGTSHHTIERVGRRHTQIIMTMGRDDGTIDTVDMLLQILDLLEILLWQTVACRIRDVHHRSTSLDHSLYHLGEIRIVRATSILTVELHIVDEALGILRGCYRALENLLAGRVELVLDVLVAGTNTRVDALVLGILQRVECHIDILLHCTRQRTDHRPRDGLGDLNHGIKVART